MTTQCGIATLRNLYLCAFDRDFPGSDDNMFDVLEHFDMPPVRLMSAEQRGFVLGEMHTIALMVAQLDKVNKRNKVTGAG